MHSPCTRGGRARGWGIKRLLCPLCRSAEPSAAATIVRVKYWVCYSCALAKSSQQRLLSTIIITDWGKKPRGFALALFCAGSSDVLHLNSKRRGAWEAQSAERPTPGFRLGRDLRVVGWSPALGSALSMGSAGDSLPLPLSPQINKS